VVGSDGGQVVDMNRIAAVRLFSAFPLLFWMGVKKDSFPLKMGPTL
jgi:hypothetical protein